MRPSPERNALYSKVLTQELMPVERKSYNKGALIVLKSIKKKGWLNLLREMLGLAPGTQPEAIMSNIVTAITNGYFYPDYARKQYYLMIDTERETYPHLVIHGKIVKGDDDINKVQINLGSDDTSADDAPFMLLSESREWFIILDHKEKKGGGTTITKALFSTDASTRDALDETSIHEVEGATPPHRFDIIRDTVTPAEVKEHMRKQILRSGPKLDYTAVSKPAVHGSTRHAYPALKLSATATSPSSFSKGAPPPFPRLDLYKKVAASLAISEGWDVTRLLEHTREDEKHAKRLHDAGADDSMNRETLEAMKQFLHANPTLLKRLVLPYPYRMFNKGGNSHEIRSNFLLPIYAQRPIASDTPGVARFELYGKPLGTVQPFFTPEGIEANVLSFATFYSTEMIRSKVADSTLHRAPAHGSSESHLRRFRTMMETPLEDMVAIHAPGATPALPVVSYALKDGEPVRTIV